MPTPDEEKRIEEIAERAATRAVQKMMQHVGLDTDDYVETRRDLLWLRDIRKGRTWLRRTTLGVIITCMVSYLVFIITQGFSNG